MTDAYFLRRLGTPLKIARVREVLSCSDIPARSGSLATRIYRGASTSAPTDIQIADLQCLRVLQILRGHVQRLQWDADRMASFHQYRHRTHPHPNHRFLSFELDTARQSTLHGDPSPQMPLRHPDTRHRSTMRQQRVPAPARSRFDWNVHWSAAAASEVLLALSPIETGSSLRESCPSVPRSAPLQADAALILFKLTPLRRCITDRCYGAPAPAPIPCSRDLHDRKIASSSPPSHCAASPASHRLRLSLQGHAAMTCRASDSNVRLLALQLKHARRLARALAHVDTHLSARRAHCGTSAVQDHRTPPVRYVVLEQILRGTTSLRPRPLPVLPLCDLPPCRGIVPRLPRLFALQLAKAHMPISIFSDDVARRFNRVFARRATMSVQRPPYRLNSPAVGCYFRTHKSRLEAFVDQVTRPSSVGASRCVTPRARCEPRSHLSSSQVAVVAPTCSMTRPLQLRSTPLHVHLVSSDTPLASSTVLSPYAPSRGRAWTHFAAGSPKPIEAAATVIVVAQLPKSSCSRGCGWGALDARAAADNQDRLDLRFGRDRRDADLLDTHHDRRSSDSANLALAVLPFVLQKLASAPILLSLIWSRQQTPQQRMTLTYLNGMDPFTARVHGLRALSIARRPRPYRRPIHYSNLFPSCDSHSAAQAVFFSTFHGPNPNPSCIPKYIALTSHARLVLWLCMLVLALALTVPSDTVNRKCIRKHRIRSGDEGRNVPVAGGGSAAPTCAAAEGVSVLLRSIRSSILFAPPHPSELRALSRLEIAGMLESPVDIPKPCGEPGTPGSPSETQKLINTIKASFAELRETSNEQSNSLKAALERLSMAIEVFKGQPQSSDKKTAFWTAYKTLADEFDKEFLRKYGNDLDTSLIFAGLFSAVSSAFIIQIQPEFQPDPNATTEALLLILIQNITGPLPGMQIPPQIGPPTTVVLAQSLLYFSLFSTLLAALLAVLGKQWLLHYDSVGERGTIEERGLERQRKFDGLRRWKFDLIMQIFPLLLQVSLLLFAAALSVYLWTINRVIAGIVLGLTALGLVLYTLMVVSALAAPDSPFQTSLTALLRVVMKLVPLQLLQKFGAVTLCHSLSLIRSTTSVFTKPIYPLLPRFILRKSCPRYIFDEIPEPSSQVPAVVWALETSTDPRLVETAAAMVPDLQWPVDLDLRPSLRRLSDIFNGCFDGPAVREGMNDRATSCMKAFGLLEMVTERLDGWSGQWTFPYLDVSRAEPELRSMVKFFRAPRTKDMRVSAAITQWTLRFIGSRWTAQIDIRTVLARFCPDGTSPSNTSLFADFLFSVNSFFMPPMAPRDLSLMDKSKYGVSLLTILCENLAKYLRESSSSYHSDAPARIFVATRIVHRIAEFKFDLASFQHRSFKYEHRAHLFFDYNRLRHAVYHLCASPGLEQSTITSLLPFVRFQPDTPPTFVIYSPATFPLAFDSLDDVSWVYSSLEQLYNSTPKNVAAIGDLVQALFLYRHRRNKPSPTALRAILSIITSGVGDPADSTQTLKYLAFRVLSSADHWFQDDELGPVLQEHAVWAMLGAVRLSALTQDITIHYISLGDKLSQLPQWKPVIAQDLTGWLSHLGSLLDVEGTELEPTQKLFGNVLSRVWGPHAAEHQYFGEEKLLVMVFGALTNALHQLNSSTTWDMHHVILLAQWTIVSVFHARMCHFRTRQLHMFDLFRVTMVRLGDTLARSAEMANAAATAEGLDGNQDLKDVLTSAAKLLSKLGSTINDELSVPTSGRVDYDYGMHWGRIREGLNRDLDSLRQLVRNTPLASSGDSSDSSWKGSDYCNPHLFGTGGM
ncbi:hypothetical protein FB451DRAFT_1401537 [Mycena latifolia]|nr:hypothetical protein FB451DRAFT_1401537 [Mycena latifolia]